MIDCQTKSIFLFTNVDAINYYLQNFARAHKTLINLIHGFYVIGVGFIKRQDSIRVFNIVCQLSSWPSSLKRKVGKRWVADSIFIGDIFSFKSFLIISRFSQLGETNTNEIKYDIH